MKIKIILALFLVQISSLAVSDSHEELALRHIELTKLEDTFSITANSVQTNLTNHQSSLLLSSKVKGNPSARKLTIDFIRQTKGVAESAYDWSNVEALYVKALMDSYSKKELSEFNQWLSSKYGKLFIDGQREFMLKTIDISAHPAKQFKKEVSVLETEYIKELSKLQK